MSENPEFPDAHPTAPGGMSQQALVNELTRKHGWDYDAAMALSWPDKIDCVIDERRTREQEAREEQIEQAVIDGHVVIRDDVDEILAEIAEAQGQPIDTALFQGSPTTRDYIFDGHAGAGPSGAERWMTCTESLGASRRFLETLTPNQQAEFAKGSGAARQGTTAHAAGEAELLLLLGRIEEAERDATLLELTVMPEEGHEAYDEDMAEHVHLYTDLVTQYATERGDDHVLIEQRVEAAVPLSRCTTCLRRSDCDCDEPADVHVIGGSGDTIILPTKAEPDLVVIDYKHGEGIDVDVDSNPQVRIYGLGALALLTDDEGNLITGVETVTYHIVQPRNGGIKTWTETLDDLLDWRDDVLSPALTAALTGQDATYAPSDTACQWCPAKGSCAALAEKRVTDGAELFDTIVEAEFADGPGAFPETGTLDNDRLGALLSQIEGLVQIKDDLRAEAQRRLHRGEEVPGYKLVGYTPPRKWVEGAAEALDPVSGEDIVPDGVRETLWQRKLLTPKQALTLLVKQHGMENAGQVLADLMDSPVQKPVIAREDDRRHEWKGAPPEQMFPDLGEDEA